MAAGLDPVDHLDAADLDHPVAARGLRPVVSVSKTISRMAALYTRREAKTSEDRVDLRAGLVEAARRCR